MAYIKSLTPIEGMAPLGAKTLDTAWYLTTMAENQKYFLFASAYGRPCVEIKKMLQVAKGAKHFCYLASKALPYAFWELIRKGAEIPECEVIDKDVWAIPAQDMKTEYFDLTEAAWDRWSIANINA